MDGTSSIELTYAEAGYRLDLWNRVATESPRLSAETRATGLHGLGLRRERPHVTGA